MNCSACQTELPSGARFCMNCGTPVSAVGPVWLDQPDALRLTRLTAAVPDTLAHKVRAAERLSGERRMATALFVDTVGSTYLVEQLGAVRFAELLNGLLDRIYPVVYRYEGTIAHLQADELLAFFGAPVAHEDDPVRAVQAALDILWLAKAYAAEVRQRDQVEFAIRLSLSTGPVMIGPVSSDMQYGYSALGGDMNLAMQVEAAKLPMSVLISEHTYRFVAPFFDCTDLGVMEAGQMSRPVHIYRVNGQLAIPGPARGLAGLHSPMVGRSRELNALLQLSGLLQAGMGRAVAVMGEPGLGKSRLLREWQTASAPGLRWVEGRCLSYGQQMAYHLILSLLRSILGISATTSEPETRSALLALVEDLFSNPLADSEGAGVLDVYPYLGHLLELRLEGQALERVRSLDPQALKAQYQAALRRLLRALARRSPLVVVLEDVHWADPSSVEMLIQMFGLVSSEQLLICLATRSERESAGWRLLAAARELLGGKLTELPLDALSETQSRELVSNLLNIDALTDRVRSLILRRAEGNPFFVEEVLRMLIDRGAIIQVDGLWQAGSDLHSVEIPDNLQGLLLARIDRLPESVRHTLRVAAVIGRQFPVKVLEYVLAREHLL